jgi:hypothetical protein
MRGALVLAAVVLAGCASAPGDGTFARSTDASPGLPPARLAAITGCESSCFEPTVASDGAGDVYVVAGEEERAAASHDGGRTFAPLKLPPHPAAAPEGNVRVDQLVAVDAQGLLYYAAYVGLDEGPIPPPVGLQVATSRDHGASWATDVFLGLWAQPTGGVVAPWRMWLAFAPDGTAYLDFNQRPGGGVWIGRSDDHGATWTPFVRVQPATDRILSSFFSPPLVGKDGSVMVAYFGDQHPDPSSPLFFRGEDLRVARSTDKGATFQQRLVEAAPPGGSVGSAFPQLAQDAAGRLVVAWWDGRDVVVATSADGGATWTRSPARWGAPGGAVIGPWLDAHAADGKLDVLSFAAPDGALTLARGRFDTTEPLVQTLAPDAGARGDFPFFARDAGRIRAVIGTGNQTADVLSVVDAP